MVADPVMFQLKIIPFHYNYFNKLFQYFDTTVNNLNNKSMGMHFVLYNLCLQETFTFRLI